MRAMYFFLMFFLICSCKSRSNHTSLETPESEEAEPTPQEQEAMEKINTELVGLNLTDEQSKSMKGKTYNTVIDFFLPQDKGTLLGISFRLARKQAKKEIIETLTQKNCRDIKIDISSQDIDYMPINAIVLIPIIGQTIVGLDGMSYKGRLQGHASCPQPMLLTGSITDYTWVPSTDDNKIKITLTTTKDQNIVYESDDSYFSKNVKIFTKKHASDTESLIIFEFPDTSRTLILPKFNQAVDKSKKKLNSYLAQQKCTNVSLPLLQVKSWVNGNKGIILGTAQCKHPISIQGLVTGYSSSALEAFTGINFRVYDRTNGEKITEVNDDFGG